MLTIYRYKRDIPNGIKYVNDNDAYFDAKSKLLNNDLVKQVLWSIDKAKYVSENIFIGIDIKLGGLSRGEYVELNAREMKYLRTLKK